MSQLAMCINNHGVESLLSEGKTYTISPLPSCCVPCVYVEEVRRPDEPWFGDPIACFHCCRVIPGLTAEALRCAFRSSRFIPLNDPDLKEEPTVEEIERLRGKNSDEFLKEIEKMLEEAWDG